LCIVASCVVVIGIGAKEVQWKEQEHVEDSDMEQTDIGLVVEEHVVVVEAMSWSEAMLCVDEPFELAILSFKYSHFEEKNPIQFTFCREDDSIYGYSTTYGTEKEF
jgi:hypothetical protein